MPDSVSRDRRRSLTAGWTRGPLAEPSELVAYEDLAGRHERPAAEAAAECFELPSKLGAHVVDGGKLGAVVG
ncbi:MAG: hypothetical protein WAU06_10520, partial [Candidatus Nanopelagicales bacterium]